MCESQAKELTTVKNNRLLELHLAEELHFLNRKTQMGASQRSLGLVYHTPTAGVLGSSVPTTHLTQGANPRQSPQAPSIFERAKQAQSRAAAHIACAGLHSDLGTTLGRASGGSHTLTLRPSAMEVGWTSDPGCCPSEATAMLVPRLCIPKASPPCVMQDAPKPF